MTLSKFPRRMILPSVLLVLVVALPFLAPLISGQDPIAISVRDRLSPPSWEHLLGQDEFGRDRLARILWGGQVSLTVAFVSTTIAAVFGTLFGMVGAYLRSVFEQAVTRLADIVLCFPPILLALLAVTLFGPGASTLVVVLAILSFPLFARIAFSETLRTASLDFVEASRALGTPGHRIVLRSILPNIAGPLLVQYSLSAGAAIVIESGMSFLGLGVVPPEPSWGQMIRGARSFMAQDPWGIVIPCVALTLTIWAIYFFCDRLRDQLDPKTRGGPVKKVTTPANARAKTEVLGEDEVARIDSLKLSIGQGAATIDLIEDVSLTLRRNECTALVGESGSGKSLTSLALMGLLPDAIRRTGGSTTLTRKSGDPLDPFTATPGQMEALRGEDAAMIFQEPMTALNPTLTVGRQLTEGLIAHRGLSRDAARTRAIELLEKVGIPEPVKRYDAYPFEMSGGMRQRVVIAIALACGPQLLIADEPTTALDVTIQAEIIDLLGRLRHEQAEGLSLLFITHDLGVVAEIADRICVMYSGSIVEEGPADQVLSDPHHPYTKALLSSMPSAHDELHSARGDRLRSVGGVPPLPSARPSGCVFRDRCPMATEACAHADPALHRTADGSRAARCHYAPEAPAEEVSA